MPENILKILILTNKISYNSSLKLDTEIKAKAYSQAGLRDYWVLDVVNRELIVFRNPTKEGYDNQEIITANQTISPLEFPDLEIVVGDMLPLPVN